MRRKERQITDKTTLEEILSRATVCRLGLTDGKASYIVPMSFGYRDRVLYFHSAAEGRKINFLRRNPNVCFEVETDVSLIKGTRACNFTMAYSSVMGEGAATFIEDAAEKEAALSFIAEHYGAPPGDFSESALRRTAVFTVQIHSMTGKQSPPKRQD